MKTLKKKDTQVNPDREKDNDPNMINTSKKEEAQKNSDMRAGGGRQEQHRPDTGRRS